MTGSPDHNSKHATVTDKVVDMVFDQLDIDISKLEEMEPTARISLKEAYILAFATSINTAVERFDSSEVFALPTPIFSRIAEIKQRLEGVGIFSYEDLEKLEDTPAFNALKNYYRFQHGLENPAAMRPPESPRSIFAPIKEALKKLPLNRSRGDDRNEN